MLTITCTIEEKVHHFWGKFFLIYGGRYAEEGDEKGSVEDGEDGKDGAMTTTLVQ